MPRRSPEELGLRELGGGVAVDEAPDDTELDTPPRRSPEQLGLRELTLTPQGLPTLDRPARIPPMMPSHQVAPTPTAGPATAPTQMKAPALLPSHPRTGPGVAASPYDTRLAPDEETQFQGWKQTYAPNDSGQDYDLRGAFKAGLEPDPATGHWPDTYKKPNHPTFSNESQYADYGQPGSWRGEKFIAPGGNAEPQVAPVAPKPINPKGPTAFPVLPLTVEAPPQPAPKEGQTADISQRAGAPIASIPPALISPEKAPYGTTPEEQVTPPGEMREEGTPDSFNPADMYLNRDTIAQRALVDNPLKALKWANEPQADFKTLVNFTLPKFTPQDHPIVYGMLDALSRFTTPQNVAFMVATGGLTTLVKGTAGRLISLGFGADTIGGILDQSEPMRDAADVGDWDKVNNILGEMLVSGTLAQSFIRHGTGAAGIGPQIKTPEMPSLGKMVGMPQEPGQPFPDWYLRYQDMRRATVRGAENLAGTLRGPKTGEILPVEPQAPQARQQLTEGEPVVTVPGQKPEAPRPTPETKVETPTPFEGPVEKTWLPEPTQLKPSERMLPAAEPYVEKIIKEKEQAEEQRDQARREAEIDPRTGQGSNVAFKRALPAAEADPNTEIGSLDLANLKARNDLDSPAAGDKEIENAADALVQAATELGVSPRVFTPKGDELYIFGPKGEIQPLVDRAAEIYGRRQIGDSKFHNFIRGGVGPTLEKADAAMNTLKAAESTGKYRNVSESVGETRKVEPPAPEEPKPEAPRPVAPSPIPGKLRESAEALQKHIDEKRNPATAQQNPTARRANIMAGMAQEAENMERLQTRLRQLADAHEAGTIPKALEKVTTKTQVENILRYQKYPNVTFHFSSWKDITEATRYTQDKKLKKAREMVNPNFEPGGSLARPSYDDLKHLSYVVNAVGKMGKPGSRAAKAIAEDIAKTEGMAKAGIYGDMDFQEAKKALAALGEIKKEPPLAQKLREKERDLIGRKIPGYFPTPKALASVALAHLDVKPGELVLEPSAGKGNMADVLREEQPGARIHTIEPNSTLREILDLKGYESKGHDFLEYNPTGADQPDKILMNPPFEEGQEMAHVKHAYEILKPGGRIVSIMSEGPFFREDAKARAFRDWLESVEGETEKNPEKSFTGAGAERQTGVATRTVVIDKPAEFVSKFETFKKQWAPEVWDQLLKDTQFNELLGSKKWDLAKARAEELTPKAEPKKYDQGTAADDLILRAGMTVVGAKAKWLKMAEGGATDTEIRAHLADTLGLGGGYSDKNANVQYKGGKEPFVKVDIDGTTVAMMRGTSLVKFFRDAFKISKPTEPKVEAPGPKEPTVTWIPEIDKLMRVGVANIGPRSARMRHDKPETGMWGFEGLVKGRVDTTLPVVDTYPSREEAVKAAYEWLKKPTEPVVENPAAPKPQTWPEHIQKKFDQARRELEKREEELPAQKGGKGRTYTDQEWTETPQALIDSTQITFKPGELYAPDVLHLGPMAINFLAGVRGTQYGAKTRKGVRYTGIAMPNEIIRVLAKKTKEDWTKDLQSFLAKIVDEWPKGKWRYLGSWENSIDKRFDAVYKRMAEVADELQGIFSRPMDFNNLRDIVLVGTDRDPAEVERTELHERAHIRHLNVLIAAGKSSWTDLVDADQFLNSPLVIQAIDHAGLDRNYPQLMQPTEVASRLSSGESMGLSIEEMATVFTKFFDLLLEKHGNKAYTVLGDLNPVLEDVFYEKIEPKIERWERWHPKPQPAPRATSSISGRGQEPTVIDPEEPLGPIYQQRAQGEPPAEREELTASEKETVSILADPGQAIFDHGVTDPGKWLKAMRSEFPLEKYGSVNDRTLRDTFKQVKAARTAPEAPKASQKWITERPEYKPSDLIEKLDTNPKTEALAIVEIEKIEARLEKIQAPLMKPPTWSGGQPTRRPEQELVTSLVNRDPHFEELQRQEGLIRDEGQAKYAAFKENLPIENFKHLSDPYSSILRWAKVAGVERLSEWDANRQRALAIVKNKTSEIGRTRRNAHLKLAPLRSALREAEDIARKMEKNVLEFEKEAVKYWQQQGARGKFNEPLDADLSDAQRKEQTDIWKSWDEHRGKVSDARQALRNYWDETIKRLGEEERLLTSAKDNLEEQAGKLYEAENRPPPRKPGEPEVKLTPQQQKKYLLDRAEKALAAAPERKPGASPEGKKARRKWVTIDVPGDGYFNIFNDKTSLSEFIKKASTQFPTSSIKAPGPPAKPSRAISNKRVTGEGIEYYNEFRPRRQDVVTGGPKGTKNSYEDGFYSNGTYAILTERPKGIEIEPNAKMKGFLESLPAGLVEGKIVGEFLHEGTQIPILHVTAPSRSDRFIDPIYADAILTKYPNAKAFVPQDEKAPIYFKEGGKVVGIVGPLKAQTIPDSLAERAQELSPGRKAPGGAGQADMGGYADRSGSQAELFMDKDEAARRGRQGYAGYEPTGGEAPPPGKSYMDKSRGIVRLPEIIQIIRAVNENKIPGVKKYLAHALGRFIYNSAGTGDIQVKADIFLGEMLDYERTRNGSEWDKYQVDMRISLAGFYDLSTIVFKREWRKGFWTFMTYRRDPTLAAKVIAHELGHMVDWLGDPANAELDKTLKRGNILGRIATLKGYLKESLPGEPLGDQPLTEAEKEELKKQAARELRSVTEQEVDEIIRTETNYTPDDILEIFKGVAAASTFDPKLYEFIQRLDRAQKKLLIVEALKGRLAETRPPTPKKIVETPTGNKIKVTVEATPEMIAARYRELIEAAMRGRQLLERKVVTEELKRVTHIWKPFMPGPDSYTKYRYSSKELYADAISVLMNEPELLRKEAPTFYHGLFAYIDRKPDVKDLYDAIQEKMGNTGDLMNDRLSDTYDMFKRGYEIRENLNIQQQSMVESIKDSTARYFIDKMHGPLKHIRVMEKAGGERAALAKEARYQLEEIAHLADAVENYFYHIGDAVLKPLKKNGITPEQLGAYLFLRRAAFERTEIANPLGQVEAEAKLTLEGLKHSMGEEKFQQLKDIAEAWREVRQRYIIPEIVQSRFYSEEINDLFLNNPHYVRFNVLHHLEKAFGTGVTVKIHKQYGTLSEIENPFVATVLQDIAMMRATAINNAKRALVRDVLTPLGEAKQPEMKWNSFTYRNEPKQPRDPHKDLLPVMENGKLVFYEVSREITRSFENEPYVAKMIGRVWGMMNQGIRDLLVSRNPIWMARNVIRDLRSTYKNLSEIPVYGDPVLGRIYLESFKEAWKDTMSAPEWLPQGMRWEHERSQTISEMRAGKMLIPGRMYESSIVKSSGNAENEVERMARSFEIDLGDTIDINAGQSARALESVKWVYDVLGRMGQVSEMTGKIAGYKYLKENQTLILDEGVPGGMRLLSGRSNREIGHMVRGRVSTPDIKKQGEGQAVTNNLFLFSNVNAQGLRAAWESFKEDKSGYAWKTIATNMLPKIIMWGIGLGIAGGFARRMTQGISEYDKAAYTIVPLGMNSKGKTVYMRIPEDYEGQYWGAITWMMLKGQVTDAGGVINQTGEQVPWNISKLNPFLKVAWRLYQYYGLGVNPTDEWRGRTIMPDRVFKAGGSGANIALGKQVWKDLGGSVLWNPSGFELNTDEGVWERISRHLPFNILGTFIKVSDQGIGDQLDQISKATTKETAKRQVDVQSRIIKSINAAQGKPNRGDMRQLFLQLRHDQLLTPQTSEKEFETRYFSFATRAQANPYLNRIINATSNLEKERLLTEYRKMLTPQEYDDIINRLATSRAEPSVRKVEKQSRREPSVQPVR